MLKDIELFDDAYHCVLSCHESYTHAQWEDVYYVVPAVKSAMADMRIALDNMSSDEVFASSDSYMQILDNLCVAMDMAKDILNDVYGHIHFRF